LPNEAGSSPPGTDLADVYRLELRRARTRALGLVVGVYVVAVVGLVVLTLLGSPPDWWGAALLLAFVAMAPLLAASTWHLLRRRFWPGLQAIRWANGDAAAAWNTIDRGGLPADADEALARLAGRGDDNAVAMRVAWLAAAGRTADLRGVLESWEPTDSVNIARRARCAWALATPDGVADDFGPAWEAATAIPNPDERARQQAHVLIEDARRRAEAGRDPFPRLIEARRLLGARAAEFDTDEDRRVVRRWRLMVLAAGLAPALVVAVIAVAAWSGLLG
jgi:hypothetical protein